jgi:TolB-like protein
VINRRLDVDRLDRERGYSPVAALGVFEYESGTLVIDVVDAHTDRVVWRGWAEHSVDDILASRDRMAATIDRAVEQMLARFPWGK